MFFYRRAIKVCSALVLSSFVSLSVQARTWVFPHFLESRGLTASNTFVFDSAIILSYTQSVAGTNQPGSATVDFYLYDDTTGAPMRSATDQEICNPCQFQLNESRRKQTIFIEDLAAAKGGMSTLIKLGYGVAVVSGNTNAVTMQMIGINSHSSTTDLGLFTYPARKVIDREVTDPPPAARTFVIPHILETRGSINNTPFTFDTFLYANYDGGQPGSSPLQSAVIDLYLYDQRTHQPMVSGAGTAVCNPCSFDIGLGALSNQRNKRTISLEALVNLAGGFGDFPMREGYAVVSVRGNDPEGVHLQGFVFNSHTGPFDLSVFGFEPQPIQAASGVRTLVIPHTLERSGSITNPLNFDTTLYATYTAGLLGTPPGAGASVELFLYEVNGQPMSSSAGSAVCNPCTFALSSTNAKQVISFEELMQAAGGFPLPVKLGFGVVNVTGPNPEAVTLQGMVMNSISSSSNLNMFDALLLPLTDRAVSGSTNFPNRRVFYFPHYLEKSGRLIGSFAFDSLVYVVYAGGRDGFSLINEARVKLYLYEDSGLPVMGQNGAICNPCTFTANYNTPKLVLSLEELIVLNGGRLTSEIKSGFVVLAVEGDVSSVQAGIWPINTHTSPFDLSAMTYGGKFLETLRLLSPSLGIEKVAGGMALHLPTTFGFNYAIETANSVLSPSWDPLTQITGNGEVQSFTDLDLVPPQKFYRAREF